MVFGGHCKSSEETESVPPTCEGIVEDVPSSSISDFQTHLFASTFHKLKLKTSRRVATMYNLECERTDSISKVRCVVKRFIVSSDKGKKSLEACKRERAWNPDNDTLCDT